MSLRSRIVLAVRQSRTQVFFILPDVWVPWQGGLHRWGEKC